MYVNRYGLQQWTLCLASGAPCRILSPAENGMGKEPALRATDYVRVKGEGGKRGTRHGKGETSERQKRRRHLKSA